MKNYKSGFVYIWRDSKHKKFYIGSHLGELNDGYIGSNVWLQRAYKKRPETFKRRILEFYENIDHKDLLRREELWLQLISIDELRFKYYNEKRFATGGDIISDLSDEKRKQHKERSIAVRKRGYTKWLENTSQEELSERGKYARSKVKNASGGSMPGDSNPSKREDVRKKISATAKLRDYPGYPRKYKITFPDGLIDIVVGQNKISELYCSEIKIKFSKFIDTNIPIISNRIKAKMSPLYGAIIETIHENI